LATRLAATIARNDCLARPKRAEITDPVLTALLTAHLHDSWDAITAIRGDLPYDEESARLGLCRQPQVSSLTQMCTW